MNEARFVRLEIHPSAELAERLMQHAITREDQSFNEMICECLEFMCDDADETRRKMRERRPELRAAIQEADEGGRLK